MSQLLSSVYSVLTPQISDTANDRRDRNPESSCHSWNFRVHAAQPPASKACLNLRQRLDSSNRPTAILVLAALGSPWLFLFSFHLGSLGTQERGAFADGRGAATRQLFLPLGSAPSPAPAAPAAPAASAQPHLPSTLPSALPNHNLVISLERTSIPPPTPPQPQCSRIPYHTVPYRTNSASICSRFTSTTALHPSPNTLLAPSCC